MTKARSDRMRESGFKLKERRFIVDFRKKFSMGKVVILEQAAQRKGGWPNPGNVQGQTCLAFSPCGALNKLSYWKVSLSGNAKAVWKHTQKPRMV